MERATLKDLEPIPENKVGEIIDGVLYVSPLPAPREGLAKTVLGAELGGPFWFGRGGPGGWWIFFAPELHLGDDALVPDVVGWRRERMPKLPKDEFTLVPDWVCEVVSPSSAYLDLVKKLPRYAKHGVRHVWLVRPRDKTVQVYRLTGDLWTLVVSYAADDKIRAEPFDAVELDLAPLWAEAPET